MYKNTETKARAFAADHRWRTVDHVQMTNGVTFYTWTRDGIRVTAEFDRGGRCTYLSRWNTRTNAFLKAGDQRSVTIAQWLSTPYVPTVQRASVDSEGSIWVRVDDWWYALGSNGELYDNDDPGRPESLEPYVDFSDFATSAIQKIVTAYAIERR